MTNELKQVAEALKSDRELFYTWQCNIAMYFIDECERYKKMKKTKYLNMKDISKCANSAAVRFLTHLINESINLPEEH
jgi:hypothetical protein